MLRGKARLSGWLMALGILLCGITASNLLTQTRSCAIFNFQPSTNLFGAGGGTGQVIVDRGPIIGGVYTGCAWTARSNVPWIVITSSALSDQAGMGTVQYTVSGNPSSIQRTGTITFSAGGYSSATYIIRQAGAAGQPLVVLPGSLTFYHKQIATAAPPPQSLAVSTQQPRAVPFSATAFSSPTAWLSVSQRGNSVSPGTVVQLFVSVDPGNLTAGTYSGQITLNEGGSSTAAVVNVPVTLVVEAPPVFIVPERVTFIFDPAQPGNTLQKTIPVISRTGASIGFNVVTAIVSPQLPNWLSVGQASGVTPANLEVSVSPAGLGLGHFVGFLTITEDDPACSASVALGSVGFTPSLAGSSSVPRHSNGDCPPHQTTMVFASSASSGSLPPLNASKDLLQFETGVPVTDQFVVTTTQGQQVSFVAIPFTQENGEQPCALDNCWLRTEHLPPPPPMTLAVTPGSVAATATPAATSPGQHFGVIQVLDNQSSPNGDTVNVELIAGNAPVISAGPDPAEPIALTYRVGEPSPTLSIPVGSSGGPLSYSVIYSSDTGWLSGPSAGVTGAPLNLSVSTAGLALGNHPAGIVIRAPGSANQEVTVSLTLNVTTSIGASAQPGRLISQIADSQEWKTTIVVVNTDPAPGQFNVRFRSGSGAPLGLPLIGLGPRTEIAGQIPGNGSRTFETDGIAPGLLQGWADVQAPGTIGGTAIFRQRVPGRPDSEAAVPIGSSQGRRLLLPFDNTRDFGTSLALVNPDGVQGTVIAATFRGEDGSPILSDTISLLPSGQFPFSLPGRYQGLRNRRGVAEFSSSTGEMSGLGLRFSPNQTFTSFELLVPPAGGSAPARQVGSQLADGQGWKTTIIIVNTDSVQASYTLRFWRGDGSPLVVPLGTDGNVSQLSGVLPVNGVRFFETDGTASGLSQGWVELTTSNFIGGRVVFRQRVGGRPDSEAAVPFVSSSSARPIVIPLDNMLGFVTSVALVNPNPAGPANIAVTLRDENGLMLGNSSVVLGPRGQTAFEVPRQFQASADRRGTVEFFDPNNEIIALGLRFSPPPLNTFTSLPVLRK